MGNGKKAAAVGVPVAVLLTVIGGMTLNLDLSQTNTNIGQIGDNIFNQFLLDQGIDVDQYRANCLSGVYKNDPNGGKYCDLVT